METNHPTRPKSLNLSEPAVPDMFREALRVATAKVRPGDTRVDAHWLYNEIATYYVRCGVGHWPAWPAFVGFFRLLDGFEITEGAVVTLPEQLEPERPVLDTERDGSLIVNGVHIGCDPREWGGPDATRYVARACQAAPAMARALRLILALENDTDDGALARAEELDRVELAPKTREQIRQALAIFEGGE